uniref:Uncharacterized protein n=1 Tax=Ciona savignyi TaxID=51511 RepID=H2YXG1_CIOSA
QLDLNLITCIQDQTFRPLRRLEVLTLNNNNLTHVSPLVLRGKMPHLRTLRLHSNPIRCNCHMAWLADWLSDRPTMAVFTQCAEPISLRGLNLASADRSEFLCNEITAQRAPTCEITSCPAACICINGIVDCRDRGLTVLPATFPLDTTELRLEQNRIQIIPSFSFSSYPQLRRIDLSNNEIKEIERDAFDGLSQLSSLVMYGNKITSLPAGIFTHMHNLQMLLMNANKIKCLRQDVFSGLRSLTLLSLYDNKLQSISRGTFANLRSIETMHLAQNPFICDCHMRWLVNYVKKYKVETSGAKCAGPRRLAGKKISSAKTRKMRCNGKNIIFSYIYASGIAAECIPEAECPNQCRCDGSIVDCSRQALTAIPDNIPPYASELFLNHNRIQMITSVGLFQKLRNLKKIDLSNNQLTAIEDGAFSGAGSVLELWLNHNVLTDIRGSMFSGLNNLRTLMVRNNHLMCIGNHTFAGLSTVRHLDLYSNQIATILSGAFATMSSLSTLIIVHFLLLSRNLDRPRYRCYCVDIFFLNLLSNPLDCNCHLSWLSTWLRRSPVSSGNPRCAEPRFLREFPVADINPRDFRCSTEQEARAAPTCLPVQKCPEQCTCEGTIVRCANTGLTSVPVDDIPHDVTELYLEMNDIREIPASIKKFIYLTTFCECVVGFSGDRCENNINDCTATSCPVSNATCIDGVNTFTCRCPVGWTGTNCNEQIPDPCTLEQPCQHGGSCVLLQEIDAISYRCDCSSGYRGVNCSERFDPCLSHKCENNGLCEINQQSPIGYQCNCVGEYRGQYCTFPMDIVDVLQDDPCSDNDCQHGSECYIEDGRDYKCRCLPGYAGNKCQQLVSLSFQRNGSFIETQQQGLVDTNFTFIISTTQLNGVLMYDGDSTGSSREHLAIEFFTGHVRVSYDLGISPGSTIYSQIPINDGTPHKVELIIRDRLVSLKIDNGKTIKETMTSSMTSSSEVIGSEALSPLFIGGIRADLLRSARRFWHIRNTTSFKGCIHGLYINQSQLEFNDLMPVDDLISDIRPGCQGDGGSCSAARCTHGQCVFVAGRGITCRCDAGYTGESCNTRATPCATNACQHGTCRPNGASYTCECEKGFSGRHCETLDYCAGVDCRRGHCVSTDIGYQCKCKKHFTGRHCQIRIRSCPGTRIKQYYQVSRVSKSRTRSVNGMTRCRSRRRFTNMVCSGACPARRRSRTSRASVFGQSDAASTSCCKPLRVQSKRIRMKCSDGSLIHQVLQKVRKCGCQSCS